MSEDDDGDFSSVCEKEFSDDLIMAWARVSFIDVLDFESICVSMYFHLMVVFVFTLCDRKIKTICYRLYVVFMLCPFPNEEVN